MKKNRFNAIFFVLLGLASCKDNDEYRVASEFTEYIHRFKTEALARGRVYDFENDGLIVEFADLKDNTVGLCYYEDPIRIEIDEKYWTEISKSAGADAMKEDLLFHELGHGFLNRKHLNTILPNGDWKSMMCGGEKVDNRSWNINYREARRKYYRDELFNESTPILDMMKTECFVDTSDYQLKTNLNFDTPKQAGWPLVDTTGYKTTIESGKLRFESKSDRPYLVYTTTLISVLSDFSYQLTLESPVPNSDNMYGIIFGYIPTASDGGKDPMEYFIINNQHKMYIGNRTWYTYYVELTKLYIGNASQNTLKVVKIGQLLYYFINNIYSYCSEMETKDNGNKFGFMVPPKGVVYIDNLFISVKSSSKMPSIEKNASKTIDFRVVAAEPINQLKKQN